MCIDSFSQRHQKEFLLLEADTNQLLHEDVAHYEDLECAVVICRVRRTVVVL
jgi:hypothetical protein